jgi:DNA adenine methylase
MAKNIPVIKWSGSKRLIAKEIISYFPNECDFYFDPFLGGASVLEYLPKNAFCCDINGSLIDFRNLVKNEPKKLSDSYRYNWTELQKDYTHFLKVRENYNKNKNGYDLLFLSRTCVNGLIRYNHQGNFNNSLHYSRKGTNPDKIEKAIFDVSNIIQDYTFFEGDYSEILGKVTADSLIYLDPPYYNTKSMYYGKIDYEPLWFFIRQAKDKGAKVAMSFDGTTNNKDYKAIVPNDLFKRNILIKSGKSTFNKVIDKVQNEVYESLYLTW